MESGICTNLQHYASESSVLLLACLRRLSASYDSWKYYSGSSAYPIPSLEDSSVGYRISKDNGELWADYDCVSEYKLSSLSLRLSLLNHVINTIKSGDLYHVK